MKNIIGPKILEKLRSSDYKNSVYAIAEIIDNSIDANAKNIDIITVTKSNSIKDIYFIDNGKGMTQSILQKCVIFSESNNPPGNKNTGLFGMGLPNSSLSQCTKFSVSTLIGDVWLKNSVDINKMIASNSLEIDDVFEAENKEIKSILQKSTILEPKTIIHWTNIDRIDNARPLTLMNRCERLIGRIHRYKINEGLTIRFLNYSDNNVTPDIDHIFLENDPLYLTTGKSQVAKIINKLAKEKNNIIPEFSLDHYFSKFIIDSDQDKVKPLFFCPDEAQQSIEIKWHGKKYIINLKAALAYRDIQKPGTREGGRTLFGKELGAKIKGNPNYPSGNISWIRNGREITCGNYSLFNVTQENQRFWSIELSYDTSLTSDNILDKLLGLSNSKQSIKFTPDIDRPEDETENANENDKRQELIARITVALNDSIKKVSTILSNQATEWKNKENVLKGTSGGLDTLPSGDSTTFKVLLEALGKGAELTEDEIIQLTDRLKRYLPLIEKKQIESAVRKYSEIGLQNLIIYCELDERDLFQTDKFQGTNITLINTKHQFYTKIIEPLKEKNENEILVSVELLISALSRAGENNYFDNRKEHIKELFELTSKDLKNLLNRQSSVRKEVDDEEDILDS
jgi:hypothetical protein